MGGGWARMEAQVAGGREGEPDKPGAVASNEERPRPGSSPRSPLIIGGIAYALLFWMVLVVFMLIAWRLLGG